eukprot:SAG31_NODE_620_length_13503_cov_11.724112_4_plen_204_part_00
MRLAALALLHSEAAAKGVATMSSTALMAVQVSREASAANFAAVAQIQLTHRSRLFCCRQENWISLALFIATALVLYFSCCHQSAPPPPTHWPPAPAPAPAPSIVSSQKQAELKKRRRKFASDTSAKLAGGSDRGVSPSPSPPRSRKVNISKHLKTSQNISKHLKTSQNISKHLRRRQPRSRPRASPQLRGASRRPRREQSLRP